ncbi:prepilin-type N-terminal cleavage/methylation domain-containing protein [Limnohabitans sp. 15K]|uniref:prepilin-type N-terminal cleavage/methylation domain-containing protein n=1 Tax=Limnohabitans sp. 15K TaxID=1100706 RepID=UPI000C1F6312|nr:prepilin-type N-terminal cleavage/methylation domain-containing protein [Limnohabitans sp. 15K]PIT83117.1 type II secretion system protein GspH [Limnohabitans sp. 15K]
MRTLAAGSKRLLDSGFTLLELLVVVALIAVATAGVSLSLRDSAESALARDAQRLASLLETARAQARASGVAAQWQPTPSGFEFSGLPRQTLPSQWLSNGTRASVNAPIVLGPEPMIGPQTVALSLAPNHAPSPTARLWVATDGLRPFTVQNQATAVGLQP